MDPLVKEALEHYQQFLRQQFLKGKERGERNDPLSPDWCWNMGEEYGRITEILHPTSTEQDKDTHG